MNATEEPVDSDDSAFINLRRTKRKADSKLENCKKQARQSPVKKNNAKPDCPILETQNRPSGADGEKEGGTQCLKCPLCSKTFENKNTHLSHMKQCARKKKVTTQQLMGAVRQQEKQQEASPRQPLGKTPPKPGRANPKPGPTDRGNLDDLALAIALSRSIADAEPCGSSSVASAQSATLEKFGFTSGTLALPVVGKKKSKALHLVHSVLKRRTKEDREKLVTEKAAVILLDEDNEGTEEIATNISCTSTHTTYSNKPLQSQQQEAQLWQLGEDNATGDWYVGGLKHVLAETGSAAVDSVPAGESGPAVAASVFGDEIIPSAAAPVLDERSSASADEDIVQEITTLHLPQRNSHEDWRKLINNEKLSDIEVTTLDGRVMHLHSLVLYARAPHLVESLDPGVFSSYTASIVAHFLQFLYCGVLDGLQRGQVDSLLRLARAVKYDYLSDVLKDLNTLLKSNSGSIPSPGAIIYDLETGSTQPANLSASQVGRLRQCRNLGDALELSQEWSKHGSSPLRSDQDWDSEDISNADKSYWSFVHQERKKVEAEMHLQEKECKGSAMNCQETDKVESVTKQQESNQEKLKEEEKIDLQNKFEIGKCSKLSRSNEFEKDMFEDVENECKPEECIVLSSDPEEMVVNDRKNSDRVPSTDEEDTEKLFNSTKRAILEDIPYCDPYQDDLLDFHYSPPREEVTPENSSSDSADGDVFPPSQSLISPRTTPRAAPKPAISAGSNTPTTDGPAYFSTPLTAKGPGDANIVGTKQGRRKQPIKQVKEPSRRTSRPSRLSFRAGIGRGSLSRLRASLKQKRSVGGKNEAALITDSILAEFRTSILNMSSPKAESPQYDKAGVSGRRFVEVTPKPSPCVEYVEKVTPLQDYSIMEDALLKKHLEKYGLKKGLGRNKAKKILRHIYEELHPFINTNNGKLVKFLSTQKKKKKVATKGDKSKPTRAKRKLPTETQRKSKELAEDDMSGEEGRNEAAASRPIEADSNANSSSESSMECSTDEDEASEVEHLNPATDVSSVIRQYLLTHPQLHKKIVMYEPIWVEELKRELQMSCNVRVKLATLMDYLDQECITFKSEAQQKNSQRRNDRKKCGSKKKSPSKKATESA